MNLIYTNTWYLGNCRTERTWTYYMDLSRRVVATLLSHLKKNILSKHLSSFRFSFFSFFFFLFFLGPHLQHMEVPRLGVESELLLLAYTTATAMRDLSCVCNLHHSSSQCQIFNPLRKARDWNCGLKDASWTTEAWRELLTFYLFVVDVQFDSIVFKEETVLGWVFLVFFCLFVCFAF